MVLWKDDPSNYELINNVITWLVKVIVEERDPEIFDEALITLSYLTERRNLNKRNVIQYLIDSRCLIKLFSLLKYIFRS